MRIMNQPRRLGASPEENAALTLVLSSKGLQGVEGWLSGLRPANWTEIATLVSRHAGTEVGNLDRNVLGRLGSDEGDETARTLRDKWQGLKNRADAALSDPPGWLRTAADKMAVFMGDLREGAKVAWQGYLSTAVEYSGPVLEDYHAGVNGLNFLKADLARATASGFDPKEIANQAARIREMEAAFDRVRTTFSRLSGGASIDDLAERQFGEYKSMGAAWWVGAAIVIAGIAVLVYLATNLVKEGRGLLGQNPDEKDGDGKNAGIPLAVLGLALLIVIPFLMKD